MLALTGAFYAFPAWHLMLWSSLALSSAAAIVVGVLIHRPARPLPWWLLALAVTVFAAGDTTYNVLTTILGQERPFPSLADVFYLAMYPLAAAGLVLLIRRRTGGRDRGSLLDALSVTTAMALLSWIFFIDPYVQDAGLTWQERATSITYPLGDILLMATLARLLITSGSNRAAALLGAGVAGLLASDVVYGLGQLDGTWAIGSYYDLGWVVFYIAWGLAALRPSMADLTVPVRAPSAEMSIGRIALLMAVSLVAPGALLAESLTGDVRSATMIAASSVLLFLIVLVRLSGVVVRHRQAVERERTLRTAGADLVSAGDAADLATSVRRAVGCLVPPGATHRAVLLVDGATAGVPGPGADVPEEPSRLLQRGRPRRCRGSRDGRLRDRVGVPARADRPTHSRVVDGAPRRRGRRAGSVHPPRGSRGARLADRARGRTRDVEPGGDPAQQRGVLPDARAERPRRHPDRGRRWPHPVRQPVGGGGPRSGLVTGETRRRSRRPSRPRCRRACAVGRGRQARHPRLPAAAHGRGPHRRRGDLPRSPGRSDCPRFRAHPARRHRSAEAGAGAHPPGEPRLAHRAREPGAVPGPRRAGTGRPDERDRGRPPGRPGRLQARQRHDGPRDRRRAVWSPSPRASSPPCVPTTSRRGSAGTSSRS